MTAGKKSTKVSTEKTCKEITALLLDYLNGTLSPSVKRDFKRHLRICPDCVNFLNTYKKTVTVSGSVHSEELPVKVRENILDFLRGPMRKTPLNS